LTEEQQAIEDVNEKEEQSSAGGRGQASLTEEQQAIEDVNDILDQMVFQSDRYWSSIRKDIGDIYGKVSALSIPFDLGMNIYDYNTCFFKSYSRGLVSFFFFFFFFFL
jgi:hypothetical protein